jgi:hypothetical protein
METRINREVSLGYAQCRLAKLLSNNLVLDYHLDSHPQGNRTWRIVVELLRSAPLTNMQQPTQGFLACHQWAGLTTYAVSVQGREFWFDQLDSALNLLASNVSR